MKTRRLALSALLACACSASTAGTGAARRPAPPAAAAAMTPPKLRLPEGPRPTGYELTLTLLPERERFDGEIAIDLDLPRAQRSLWLHGEDLQIAEATVLSGGKRIAARVAPGTGHGSGDAAGFLGLTFAEEVAPGPARLEIRYSGPLSRRDNDGLFRQQEGGDWYAYSDFEPTDARRAFPCFDEPSFKVPWQVTLRVHKEHVALGNAPVESEADEPGGLRRVRFKRTRPLPSYLVAVAAGPFELVDAGTGGKGRVPLRIVTLKGRRDEARYAAKVSAELFDHLEDYFGIPYPFEKLDQIAVPRFSGAMENPGLITYGQGILLTRPDEETASSRRRYASVGAHEMAHQWFGNLVTMRYWDDIWLNESFATWMEERTLQRWQPAWDSPGERARAHGGAMRLDGLGSARAVRQPIESTHDIRNAFDGITYSKGQALLDMFEHYAGEDRFREGVRGYLRAHSFGNASADDFLQALSAAGGAELGPAMRTFLDQPGVPLVTMEARCEAGKAPVLHLRQSPYRPLGAEVAAGKGEAPRWQVPVCVRARGAQGKAGAKPDAKADAKDAAKDAGKDGGAGICVLLKEAEADLPLPDGRLCAAGPGAGNAAGNAAAAVAAAGVISGNADAAGYYRVRYGAALLPRVLAGAGDGSTLAAPERVSLLDDLGALMRSGDLPASDVMAAALRLAGDPNRHVVQSAMELIATPRRHLVPVALRPAYARLVREAFGKRARALGLRARAGDDDELRLLRRSLVSLVGGDGEDPALRAEARRLAGAWLDDRRALGPEDVDLVLRIAGRGNDAALYDRLYTEARAARTHAERARLLGALPGFTEPALVGRTISLVLADELDVRDTIRLLSGALDEDEGAELAYRFVKEHWDALLARLPQTTGAYLMSSAAAFCDEAHRADAAAFFADKAPRLPGGPRELRHVLERIHLCSALREAQAGPVATFLRRYK